MLGLEETHQANVGLLMCVCWISSDDVSLSVGTCQTHIVCSEATVIGCLA